MSAKNRLQSAAVAFLIVACVVVVGRDVWVRTMRRRLIHAIRTGDVVGVRRALAFGANPNTKTTRGDIDWSGPGESALMIAETLGKPKIVSILVKAGANVKVTNSSRQTPLGYAIERIDVADVALLLDAGADPRALCVRTSLGLALQDDRPLVPPIENAASNTLDQLRGLRMSPGYESIRKNAASARKIYDLIKNRGIEPTVSEALAAGDRDLFISLVKSGAELNVGDARHGSAAAIAVDLHDDVALQMVLDAGADATAGQGRKQSALTIALREGDPSQIDRIIDHFAKIVSNRAPGADAILKRAMREPLRRKDYLKLRQIGIMPDLATAIRFEDVPAITLLLGDRKVLDLEDEEGELPIERAVMCKSTEPLFCLLRAGAKPDISRALWIAVMLGKIEMVRTLIEHGAHAELTSMIRDRIIKSPPLITPVNTNQHIQLERQSIRGTSLPLLEIAAENNNTEIYNLLRSHGSQDSLYTAAAMGDISRLPFLFKQSGDLNALNSMRQSPLSLALMRQHLETVKWLVENGATANEIQTDGQTPLTQAIRAGQVEAVKLLLTNHADVHRANSRDETPLQVAQKQGNTTLTDIIKKSGG